MTELSKKEVRRFKQKIHVQQKEEEEPQKTVVVKGEVSQENMEWLKRSIVRETLHPLSIECVADKLFKDWWLTISKVRDMGAYKTLIVLHSKKHMEETLSTGEDLLLEQFAEIRK